MSEADVLYSDVKFTRDGGKTNVVVPSAEDTYSEVKISKPAELHGSKRPAESNPQPRLTTERVALVLVTLLLVAAITALSVIMARCHKPCDREAEAEPSKVQQDQTGPKCPTLWEQHGGKCYYFTTTPLTWGQSREVCVAVGGDLVVIDSREEQKFLEFKLRSKMKVAEDKFWIGLTDSQREGEWMWVDGSRLNPGLKFWLQEPDDWRGEDLDGEDCVRMGEKPAAYDLKCWVDKSCKALQKSICEKQEEKGLCP